MQIEMIDAFREGVFPVTARIAIGRFASPLRCQYLRKNDYTHILNVSDAKSLEQTYQCGFTAVQDIPIDDFLRIPTDQALKALGTLHAMLNVSGSKVFVHCIAGQNRCPTIVWLYLIGLGLSEKEARARIVTCSPDANQGHQSLIDGRLIEAVQEWGLRLGYIDRKELLKPAYE